MTMTMISMKQFGGAGERTAIGLSPALPEWDNGACFCDLPKMLSEYSYSFTAYDSLSLLDGHTNSLDKLAEKWSYLLSSLPPPDLVIGSALGGSLAICLLSKKIWKWKTPRVLLFSPPVKSDDRLDDNLGLVVRLSEAGHADMALDELERLVAPAGETILAQDTSSGPANDSCEGHVRVFDGKMRQGVHRLSQGLKLLRNIDIRHHLRDYEGKICTFVGRDSQLVRSENVPCMGGHHRALLVENSGMRTLVDNPKQVKAHLRSFFLEDSHE
jgi:hypothetical protein